MELSELNDATMKDLQEIEGIGHERAEILLKYRDENGDFESWDDVKKVPGFTDEIVGILREHGSDEEDDIETEE